MSIFDDLNEIDAVRQFQQEPPVIPPIDQRVRAFLASLFGNGWYAARVLSYATATGESVYAAFGPMPRFGRGTVMHLVCEQSDGSLTLAVVVDLAEDSTSDGRTGNVVLFSSDGANEHKSDYESEHACLAKILPALSLASKIIAASESVKPRRKTRLLEQLAHAASHLVTHLESMRQ